MVKTLKLIPSKKEKTKVGLPSGTLIHVGKRKMDEIISSSHSIERFMLSVEEATDELSKDYEIKNLRIMDGLKQKSKYPRNSYKLKQVKELREEEKSEVIFYQHGDFVDLTRGPHLPHTDYNELSHYKLLGVEKVYWEGKKDNPILHRVYGTAFSQTPNLENYLQKWKKENPLQKTKSRVFAEKSKWDHKIVRGPVLSGQGKLSKKLQGLGDLGWQLVDTQRHSIGGKQHAVCFLKRKRD